MISSAARCGLFAGGLVLLLGGCTNPQQQSARSPHYFVTIPPFAYILQPILGDQAEVAVLLPAGASPHTHEARPSDYRNAAAGTALFYGDETLDGWAASLPEVPAIRLMSLLPASAQLSLPDASGTDPHFWSDPMAVKVLTPILADTLCGLDPGGCTGYRTRAAAFAARLDTLDAKLQRLTVSIRGQAVLLSHPFFQYFLQRYGLELVGLIEPVPGKEPTPRTLQALIAVARQQGVSAIFIQEQQPERAAQAVAEALALPLHRLDPLGGVPQTYEAWLLQNARTLIEALHAPPTATPAVP